MSAPVPNQAMEEADEELTSLGDKSGASRSAIARDSLRRGSEGALGATHWICLLASPTFAIMALYISIGGGAMNMPAPPLSGMVPMYLLMSIFHSVPWLRLMRRDPPGKS